MATPLLVLAAGFCAAVGSVGGLGGALLLVPLLVATGTPATEAAPLGLVLVAAGSLAGGSRHLEDRSVNHRLGVTVEVAASAGAVVGALLSGVVSETVLVYALAAVALVAAVLGVGSAVFALAGSLLVPSVGDSTEAMRLGLLAGTLVAIITVVTAAFALLPRRRPAMLAPTVAFVAALSALSVTYLLPMDHPLVWPLLSIAIVLVGLAGGLLLAPVLPRRRWLRGLLVAAISLAVAASVGIMVIYAAFVAPVLAVVAFILLIRRPRRSAVTDEPSLDSEGNLARRSAQ